MGAEWLRDRGALSPAHSGLRLLLGRHRVAARALYATYRDALRLIASRKPMPTNKGTKK